MAAALTVADLEHWVRFGAAWRLVAERDGRAVVDMLACTGELVERRETDDPAAVAYVTSRRAEPADQLP